MGAKNRSQARWYRWRNYHDREWQTPRLSDPKSLGIVARGTRGVRLAGILGCCVPQNRETQDGRGGWRPHEGTYRPVLLVSRRLGSSSPRLCEKAVWALETTKGWFWPVARNDMGVTSPASMFTLYTVESVERVRAG